MSAPDVKFYNMLLHLIKNNKVYEENVALKNIWEKDGNVFLDIYFYRNRKSYIFDSVFVRDITDLTTEKYYQDIRDLAADFQLVGSSAPSPDKPEAETIPDQKMFEPIDVDLIILTFLAKCCEGYTPLKQRIIFDYILEHIPQAKNFSRQYINAYIDSRQPTEAKLYAALKLINLQNAAAVEHLCREALKLCLSDGRLHYREKLYLAELLQLCRDAGVIISLDM